jgi:microcystin degradation protein MlrC
MARNASQAARWNRSTDSVCLAGVRWSKREGTPQMRIAVCGIQVESSTFTPHRATLSDFAVTRGEDVIAAFPLQEWAPGVEFVGNLNATSRAAGPVEPQVYDELEDETAARLLSVGPVDGVWLDMHGAMSVHGRQSAEERWIRRVRRIVGAGPVLSGSFDPHGNLSLELATMLDLAAFHRHAPHIDNQLTRERAVRNLVHVLERGGRPSKAWVRVPMLLPGERTSTVVEPGATVFGSQLPTIAQYGLIDAAMCVGFFWSEEPRNVAMVFTTAWEETAALAAASKLAHIMWNSRDNFTIVSDHYGQWHEAVHHALSRPPRPLYVSDSGDNVTAGGSGDITYCLAQTLSEPVLVEAGVSILFAGLWDPHSLATAAHVEPGGQMDRAIGAHLDSRYGAPVPGRWKVLRLVHDEDGNPSEALLEGRGVNLSVRGTRTPYVQPDDAGFPPGALKAAPVADPRDFDVVIVKNGYLFPSQAASAASSFMALTPGGTDLDHERLQHQHLDRPLFPWDDLPQPDLSATLVPTWSETLHRAE